MPTPVTSTELRAMNSITAPVKSVLKQSLRNSS